MYEDIRAELAPTGTLRAAINMGNFLLVTGKTAGGEPEGVSADMAAAIAERIGVPLKLVPYATPGEIADSAERDEWDIGNIGAEPQRAKVMTFTAAYVEIEATYMVPPGSPIQKIEDVDKKGNRIAVSARSAYGLWLENNIKNAELVQVKGLGASFDIFKNDKLEALAGLRPRLLEDAENMPGARILDGQFAAVQQAIGTKPDRKKSIAFLKEFVEEAKKNGFVKGLIEKHGVVGRLSVAPQA